MEVLQYRTLHEVALMQHVQGTVHLFLTAFLVIAGVL